MTPGNPNTPAGDGTPSNSEIEQARREALRLKMTRRKLGMAGRIGQGFLESKLTPLIVVASLLLGLFAIIVTPSEEEPQIKVPMIDVMVGFPGATAEEVEHRVITPLENSSTKSRTSSTSTPSRIPRAGSSSSVSWSAPILTRPRFGSTPRSSRRSTACLQEQRSR